MIGDLQAFNIKLLKGTSHILQGDEAYYSPAFGLPFIECNIAQNIYDLSSEQVKRYVGHVINNGTQSALDRKDSAEIQQYLMNYVGGKNTATQNLASYLFHRAGVEASFLPTKVAPVQKLNVKNIGRILRIISLYEKYKGLVKGMVDQPGELQNKKQIFFTMLRSFGLGNEGDALSGNDVNNSWVVFSKDPKVFLQEVLKESIKKYVKNACVAHKKWNSFSKDILAALGECDKNDPSAMYAPNTAQGLLLGYMLTKVQNKQDLEDYFEGFLGSKVTLTTEDYLVDEMIDIAKQDPPVSDPVQFAEWLCGYIYGKNYNSYFPKMASAKEVNFNKNEFSDCVETAIRNICNIVTYDSTEQRLGIFPRMSDKMSDFYKSKDHQDPVKISDKSAHQNWAELVENQLGVAYSVLNTPDGNNDNAAWSFTEGKNVQGFILVDQKPQEVLPVYEIFIDKSYYTLYEKIINDKKYFLVPRETGLVCCELRSDLSNIIVLLSRLFGLNVCDSILDLSSQELVQNKLKDISNLLKIPLLRILFEDGTKQRIIFQKGKEQFELKVLDLHTSVSVSDEEKVTRLNIKGIHYKQYPIQVAALVSLLDTCSLLQVSEFVRPDFLKAVQLFSYVPIGNANCSLKIIKELLKIGVQGQYVKSLIFRLPLLQGYHYQRLLLDYVVDLLAMYGNTSHVKSLLQMMSVMIDNIALHSNTLKQDLLTYRSLFYMLEYNGDIGFEVLLQNIKILLAQGGDGAFQALSIFELVKKLGFVAAGHVGLIGQIIQAGLDCPDKEVWHKASQLGLELIGEKVLPYELFLYQYLLAVNTSLQAEVGSRKGLDMLEYAFKNNIFQGSYFHDLKVLIAAKNVSNNDDGSIKVLSAYIENFLVMLKARFFQGFQKASEKKRVEGRKSPLMIMDMPGRAQGKSGVMLN